MCRLNPQAASKPCSHVLCNCGQPSFFDQVLLSSKPVKKHFDNDRQFPASSFVENLDLVEKKPKVFKPIVLSQGVLVKSEPTEVQRTHIVALPRLPSFESVLQTICKPEEKQQVSESKMLETMNFLLEQQNSMLEMSKQEENLEQTLLALTQDLATIKSNFEQRIKTSKVQSQQAIDGKIVATAEMLLAEMYPKTPEFLYSLNVVGDFPQLLCREKPFCLTVELVDMRSGVRVMNHNKIEVSLALYTATNPPKLISINTTGEKPFKGDINGSLTNGTVTFSKIYPNEVSSHYMTGCVFLVAYPKFTSEYAEKMKIVSKYCGDAMIDPSLVRPWILDRLVIKAKRSRE